MSASAHSSVTTNNASLPMTDPTGFVKLNHQLPTLAKSLAHAVQTLELSLSDSQQRTLLLYLDKLLLWNKAYNLTAITDPEDALTKHIIDCLSIIAHLPKGSLLDIGTGAGLPAVIIAICQPERQCTALDSNQKKIRFIKQISSELGLSNVHPIAARIEEHHAQYEVVTSRAFASLQDFVDAAQPRLAAEGYLCAMKGKVPTDQELQLLGEHWYIKTTKLKVPRLNDSRHLIELSQKNL